MLWKSLEGYGRTLDFGCFLDLVFDPDLVEDEREDEERPAEEELEVEAFPERISVGTEPAMGMKAKDIDKAKGSDLLKEEGATKVWPHFDRPTFPSVLKLGIPIGNKEFSAVVFSFLLKSFFSTSSTIFRSVLNFFSFYLATLKMALQ